MKNIIFLLLFIAISFSACEDIVELDLEEGSVELVVDAWINTDMAPQVIKLRRTAPYFSNAFAPVVNGATVTVSDQDGRIYEFLESNSSGDYLWTPAPGERFGEIGKTYNLAIEVDGNNFSASTQLRPTVPVDSITYEFEEASLGDPEGYYAQFFGRDRLGIGDTYWIKTYKNGVFLNKPQEINIAYDAGPSAGAEVDGLIFITPIREAINPIEDDDDESPYALGDTIRVEIHSLTQESFNYLERTFFQLTLGDSGIFAEPPANVPTNISSSTAGLKPQGFFVVSEVSSLEQVLE